MPGHTVRSAVHRGHHPKYQEQVFWVDQSNRDHIDIMIRDIENHRQSFITFWNVLDDGKRSFIMLSCESNFSCLNSKVENF